MTTRYEYSYTGDKIVRLRFIDVEENVYQDYEFSRQEFTDFIDAGFYTLVETTPAKEDS